VNHRPSPPDENGRDSLEILALRLAREKRKELLERLEAEGADDLADRLRKCGEPVGLTCTRCGKHHFVEKRCDLKWCPSCQRGLATRTSIRYEQITRDCQWPIFVTFTVRNFTKKDQAFDFVRGIRRAFTKLRRLRWFKRCVKGGVASIEVTNRGKGWHPHIHALMDCAWFYVSRSRPAHHLSHEAKKKIYKANLEEIREQWSLCLNRPGRIFLRRVYGRDDRSAQPITREVLKYSCKGDELLECEEDVSPLIRMLDGCRLVTSWGSFYRHPAAKRPKLPPRPCECGALGCYITDDAVDAISRSARRSRKR
jgi:Replication protein